MAKKLQIETGVDNPILRAISKPVIKFDKSLKKFVKNMTNTMHAAKGIGIAAPQVGENIRMFLAALNEGKKDSMLVPMINPKILWMDDETCVAEEGCLSVPDVYGNVERSVAVEIEFFSLDGARQIMRLCDLNARVVQHELDHLDGVLFVDKLVMS